MKKLIVGLFIFGFIAISAPQVHASILSDALLKIQNLQKEVSSLKSKLGAYALGYTQSYTNLDNNTSLNSSSGTGSVTVNDGCTSGAIYSYTTGAKCPNVAAPITPTTDPTPRISYWSGKVNQHVDLSAQMWQTDADGVSGADIDKLTYCKKWYPKTTSVVEYKNETINAWHDKGNINDYQNTRMSYKCVSDSIFTASTLKTTADISVPTSSAFVTASIVGSSINKEVSYWKLLISCESGVVVSSDKPNLCGTEIRMDTYNMANPSEDYLLLTAGVKNNNSISSKLTLSLSSYSSSNIRIREDKKEIIIPSSNTTTPSITVLSPNGGEVYQTGQQITVKWKTENILTPSTITVEMINNDTNESVLLGDAITLNGSVVLRLPSSTNTWKNNKIKLTVINSKEGGILARDLSDNFFTITTDSGCSNGAIFSSITGAQCLDNSTPSITVLSPNGGESYVLGQDFIPRWKVSGMSTSDEITVALEDTITKNQIVIGKKFGTDTAVGTKLPADSIWGLGNRYKIRITAENSSGNTIAQDYSDNSFTINSSPSNTGCANGEVYSSTTGAKCLDNATPSITVLSPNGGEVYQAGQKITVKYKMTNNDSQVGDKVSVFLKSLYDNSIYNFGSFRAEVVGDDSIVLTIPTNSNLVTGNYYKISARFTGSNGFVSQDESDNYFTINSTNGLPAGCTSTSGYSSTTGVSCGGSQNLIDTGCSDGDRFSKTTGQQCRVTGTDTTNPIKITRTLSLGMRGKDVMVLQSYLGLPMDGVFGKYTKIKVMQWQLNNGIIADGVFGLTSRLKAGLE